MIKSFFKKQFLAKAANQEENREHTMPEGHDNIVLEDVLSIVEVDHAQPFVGELFCRRFNTNEFPNIPRHFVAFYRADEHCFVPAGYVHHTPWEGCTLCGGLVIDERLYRKIPAHHRRVIRSAGGIAEQLQRQSFDAVRAEAKVIWGYVGDALARQVDLRVGFEPTDDPYIMAVWLKPLSEEEKKALFEKVKALGPF